MKKLIVTHNKIFHADEVTAIAFVKAVVWEDEEEQKWKVKVPSKTVGSFELNGKALKNDTSMEFVHSSGHFAIAKDEMTMI